MSFFQNRNNKNKAIDKAYDLILKLQEEQYISYKHASLCLSNPKTRALFAWLSEAEKEHLIHLLKKTNKPMDIIYKLEEDTDFVACHDHAKALEGLNEKEILLYAIRGERREIEVYEQSKAKAGNRKAEELINGMIREEEEHIFQLEQLFAQLFSRLPKEDDFKKLPPIKGTF